MKRLLLSCLIVFFFVAVYEFVFHGIILGPTYKATMELWRPEEAMMKHMPWLYGGHLVFAVFFCVIFFRHVSGRGAAAGARYGLLVGLLMSSTSLVFYCVMPLPLSLVLSWIAGGVIEAMLAGALLGVIAGPPGQGAATGA